MNVGLGLVVDWRTSIKLTPVVKQGRCSCCWAAAAISVVECAYHRWFGQYVELSMQELVDYVDPRPPTGRDDKPQKPDSAGCYKSSVNRGLRHIITHGVSRMAHYPWNERIAAARPDIRHPGSKKFIRNLHDIALDAAVFQLHA